MKRQPAVWYNNVTRNGKDNRLQALFKHGRQNH